MVLTEKRKEAIIKMLESVPEENWNEIEEVIKNAQTKQCDIHGVVWRSEQFYCWDGSVGEKVCDKQCTDCKNDDRSKKQ